MTDRMRAGVGAIVLTVVGLGIGAAGASSIMGGSAAPAPCVTEDSAGPCYWDARVQGNGVGRSFVVTSDGDVIYVGAP